MRRKKVISLVISLVSVFVIGLSFLVGFLIKEKNQTNTLEAETTENVSVVPDDATIEDKGGVLYIEEGCSYTMFGGTIGGEETKYGGAVFVSPGATFIMKGGTIENSKATYGGAIFVANGGTCVLEDAVIDNCSAGIDGGAIYLEKTGSLTIDGVEIKNCSAAGNGGGIYTLATSGTLNIKNVTFTNLDAVDGGAVYSNGMDIIFDEIIADENGPVTIPASNISYCDALGSGGAIYSKGNISTNKTTITNCTTKTNGGAIYSNKDVSLGYSWDNVEEDLWHLEQTTIKNCSADLNGGAFYSKSIYLNCVDISDCTAEESGGAVYTERFGGVSQSVSYFYMEYGKINNCSAKYGGAAYILSSFNAGNIYIDKCSAKNGAGIFSRADEIIFDEGVLITNCSATDNGGGIFASNGLDVNSYFETIVDSCEAGVSGGGIFVSDRPDGNKIKNISIANCKAGSGGGIYVNSQTKTVIDETYIENNTAEVGGGIYNAYGSQVSITGGVIFNNSATNGGGIYNNSSKTTEISGTAKIIGNTATLGGGVYSNNYTTISISGGQIVGNEATSYGGGIYAVQATVNHSGGIVGGEYVYSQISYTGNKSTGEAGGGVYIKNGTYNLTGGSVIQNSAPRVAGIFLYSSEFSMTEGSVSLNTATDKEVGGIYVYGSSTATISGGSISNNTATYGPGIFVASSSTLKMTGGVVGYNSGYRGGGIYHSSSGECVISGNVNIIGNTVTNNGGGIYINSGTLTLGTEDEEFTGNITGNNAKIYGGGIYCYSTINHNSGSIGGEYVDGELTHVGNNATSGAGVFLNSGTYNLNGGNISNNTSKKLAGGVMCNGGSLIMSGGSISQNSANSEAGGGVYLYEKAKAKISGGEISFNYAEWNGGGIYVIDTSSLDMSGGIIIENTTSGYGGGIFNTSTTEMIISGSAKIVGNQSKTSNGGGIYHYSTARLTISGDSKIAGNESSQAGGGIYKINGELFISGGQITGNSSTKSSGGGIYASGTINQTGGMIGGEYTYGETTHTGNTAQLNGGGVYLTSGQYIINKGEVVGNEASTGGGVFVNNNATLNMTGGNVSQNTAATNGGGIYFKETSKYSLEDVIISENTANDGGGIYSETSLTLEKITIKENKANNNGGGVCVANGTTTLTAVKIISNTAENYGGGIYSFGSVNISSGFKYSDYEDVWEDMFGDIINKYPTNAIEDATEISCNISTNGSGGGIYAGGNITSYGCKLLQNSAPNGSGGGFYSIGKITSDFQTIEVTVYDTDNLSNIDYGEPSEKNVVVISSSLSNYNTCGVDGGAFYASQGFYLCGSMTGNEAGNNGGSIYSSGDAEVEIGIVDVDIDNYDIIEESILTQNQAIEGSGGAIYMSNGLLKFNGSATSNTAAINGGAIYSGVDTSIYNLYYDEYQIKIQNNTAGELGGGIFTLGNLTVDDAYINCNYADKGAGIAIDGGKLEMIYGEISENTATSHGGGVYVTNGEILHSYGSISKNSSGAAGGGVYLNKSTLNISGGTVKENTAMRAAGVFVYNKSTLNLTQGSISYNKATDTYAGGVYLYSNSTAVMSGGSVEYNTSKSNGGGFYVSANSSLELSGGKINSNTAEKTTSNTRGGGIFLAGSLNMTGGTISNNKAASGGGINAFGGSTISITKGTISGNCAYRHGGAILCSVDLTLGNVDADNSDLKIVENYLSGHVLEDGTEYASGNGAAIALASEGVITMNSGMISGNYIKSSTTNMIGAGVYLTDNSKFVLNDGLIDANYFEYDEKGNPVSRINSEGLVYEHRYKGGAICLNTETQFVMNGGIIQNSDAVYGGAIYVFYDGLLESQSKISVSMTGGTITNCRADYGGAICVEGELDASLTSVPDFHTVDLMGAGTISYCSAKYDGGAAFTNIGDIWASNGTDGAFVFNSCTAGRNGGIIAADGSAAGFMFIDCSFDNISLRNQNNELDNSLYTTTYKDMIERHGWQFTPCGTLILAENGGLVSSTNGASGYFGLNDFDIDIAVKQTGVYGYNVTVEWSDQVEGCRHEYVDQFYELGQEDKNYQITIEVYDSYGDYAGEEIYSDIPVTPAEEDYYCSFYNITTYYDPCEIVTVDENNLCIYDTYDGSYFNETFYVQFNSWYAVIDGVSYEKEAINDIDLCVSSDGTTTICIIAYQDSCPNCDGFGWVDCGNCDNGIVSGCDYCDNGVCIDCGGSGECSACDGTGDDGECLSCDGGQDCVFCGGDGYCDECNGSGEKDCDVCGGIAEVECEYCYGEGSIIEDYYGTCVVKYGSENYVFKRDENGCVSIEINSSYSSALLEVYINGEMIGSVDFETSMLDHWRVKIGSKTYSGSGETDNIITEDISVEHNSVLTLTIEHFVN